MTRKAEPPDPLAEVRALLERLNLTTAARCLPELLAQAETTHPAYSEFLHQLLDAEQGSRWERKLQRRRRWSKLGPPLSLEGFDWAARPQLSPPGRQGATHLPLHRRAPQRHPRRPPLHRQDHRRQGHRPCRL